MSLICYKLEMLCRHYVERNQIVFTLIGGMCGNQMFNWPRIYNQLPYPSLGNMISTIRTFTKWQLYKKSISFPWGMENFRAYWAMVLTFKSTIMSQPFFLRVLVDKAKVFKVISYFQLFHKTLYKRYLKTPKVWKKKLF